MNHYTISKFGNNEISRTIFSLLIRSFPHTLRNTSTPEIHKNKIYNIPLHLCTLPADELEGFFAPRDLQAYLESRTAPVWQLYLCLSVLPDLRESQLNSSKS